MTQANDQTPGTLVRGTDGHLYFVPHAKLQSFRVPEKGVDQMKAKLTDGAVATHTSIPTEWMNVGLCIVHQGP